MQMAAHAPGAPIVPVPESDDELSEDDAFIRQATTQAPNTGDFLNDEEMNFAAIRQVTWPGASRPSSKLCPPPAPRRKPAAVFPEGTVPPFALPPCRKEKTSSTRKHSVSFCSTGLESFGKGDEASLCSEVDASALCNCEQSDGDEVDYELRSLEQFGLDGTRNPDSLPMLTPAVLKTFEDDINVGVPRGFTRGVSPFLSSVLDELAAEASDGGGLQV
mmetsp:Transcript_44069/g.121997  ORF Transcript_44069/g.121997 Transcript_44069/m.121997 type:complete len:218 (+) Transcript_44069:90-743(+)